MEKSFELQLPQTSKSPLHLAVLSPDRVVFTSAQKALSEYPEFVSVHEIPLEKSLANFSLIDCRRMIKCERYVTFNGTARPSRAFAIIEPDISSRMRIFISGYLDFISWPICPKELAIRIIQLSISNNPPLLYRFSPNPKLEKYFSFIITNLSKKFNLRELCDLLGTNHSSLTNLFNRELGLPPYAWLRKARMETSAERLLNTQDSISEIAIDVGYERPENFATAFRQHFGSTPSQYRRKMNRAKI